MPALENDRIHFYAKFYKNGHFIGVIRRFRKTSLFLQAEEKFKTGAIDKIYLRVKYNDNGDYNDGYYENLTSFRKAYQNFTSKELINFVNGR